MTDKELLELAAKAADIEGQYFESDNPIHTGIYRAGHDYYWNPLISDSEALRLAVKRRLEFSIVDFFGQEQVEVSGPFDGFFTEDISDSENECEAVRRAIVRAAASLANSGQQGEKT